MRPSFYGFYLFLLFYIIIYFILLLFTFIMCKWQPPTSSPARFSTPNCQVLAVHRWLHRVFCLQLSWASQETFVNSLKGKIEVFIQSLQHLTLKAKTAEAGVGCISIFQCFCWEKTSIHLAIGRRPKPGQQFASCQKQLACNIIFSLIEASLKCHQEIPWRFSPAWLLPSFAPALEHTLTHQFS